MRVRSGELREDEFTGSIERYTPKIPSSGYLGIAIGSIAASAILKILGKHEGALFVGQWVPAFLTIGVYSKLVRQHGSPKLHCLIQYRARIEPAPAREGLGYPTLRLVCVGGV
jgi:hypothetical protein